MATLRSLYKKKCYYQKYICFHATLIFSRSFGLKENYALSLQICKNCQCLFWESIGHPCIVEENPDIQARLRENQNDPSEAVKSVPPHIFLSYFSV